MAKEPGADDQATILNGDTFVVTINDVLVLRATATDVVATVPFESASIAVPVLSGANANATAIISGTEHVIFADPSSTEMGLTLPSVSDKKGQSYTIKKIAGSADVLLSGAADTELIDGDVFQTLESVSGSLTVTSDGAAWHVTAFVSASRAVW